ncbi:MAG TPA: polysaccharide biosynthesis protein [Desulfobacterales bacterium]|nr:polysaccharide biosynthesis protein [Desulfobacterales bacterium]
MVNSIYNKIYSLSNHPKTRQVVNAVLPFRLWIIVGVHTFLFALSYTFSFIMLSNIFPTVETEAIFQTTIFPLILMRIGFFWYYDLFRGLWAFVSFPDLLNIIRATVISTIIFALLGGFWEPMRIPQKVALLDMLFCIMTVGGVRFLVRNFRENFVFGSQMEGAQHVLLVGPVERVQHLMKEMNSDPYGHYRPSAVLDPTRGKKDPVIRVHDVPAFSIEYILAQTGRLRHLSGVVFCWPGASRKQLDIVVENLKPLQLPFKTLPHVDQILSGEVSMSDIRDVEIEDLLERPPVQIASDDIHLCLRNKVVLVTGGGGSIGSELCRQLAAFSPKLLVIVERAEGNLLDLQLELKKNYPSMPIHASISSVNDFQGMRSLMKEKRVDVVFHAAAYKHVPLMEVVPTEAAYNNILGTYNVAKAASECNVKRFVMISTDKAVNPTNVMGVTKRIAEMVVQSLNGHSDAHFMVVRFGNVLDSAGSVIPIFKKQIAEGGPVTVTHPEIERYFMTIPEAVQLILQASSMGHGGEIFVLDMGHPVRILHLAEKLITLSGKRLKEDIEIVFTGIRPGEKMFEELFNEGEARIDTSHPQIMMAASSAVDRDYMQLKVDHIRELVRFRDEEGLRRAFFDLVPDYSYVRRHPEDENVSIDVVKSVAAARGCQTSAKRHDLRKGVKGSKLTLKEKEGKCLLCHDES